MTNNQIVEENLGLIYSVALSIHRNGCYNLDVDDLVNTAVVTLLGSLKWYNPQKSKLSTFIHICSKRAMLKELGKQQRLDRNSKLRMHT